MDFRLDLLISPHHYGKVAPGCVEESGHCSPKPAALALTFAIRNDVNLTRVQKVMRHQHHATTKIYVEEAQKVLDGAEDAVTQI